MNALCKPSLGALGLVAKTLNLNRYISVITDIDEKWFVIFELTLTHLSFGYVRLPQLKMLFFLFSIFFLLFYFSSATLYV